jgi:hypothetical protein
MSDGKAPQSGASKLASMDTELELDAISESLKLLKKLSPEGQERAYSYIGNVLGISRMLPVPAVGDEDRRGLSDPNQPKTAKNANIRFSSLAELYSAARPETGWEKVLVGGYWFQAFEGLEEFAALVVNDALKEIGAKVANVTVAFDRLKAANPSLVLQVRKSGKAQQARKQYKLTVAGMRVVEEMIGRG